MSVKMRLLKEHILRNTFLRLPSLRTAFAISLTTSSVPLESACRSSSLSSTASKAVCHSGFNETLLETLVYKSEFITVYYLESLNNLMDNAKDPCYQKRIDKMYQRI